VQTGFASRLGSGTSWFNLGHARDVARAALLAGTAEAAHGETFLVGGPNVSQAELGEAIARALGRRRLVPLVVPRPVVRLAALGSSLLARLTGRPRIFTYGNLPRLLARNWKLDLGKAERLLGYRPEIGLERGVAETVGWYREHGWL
jgi:nucleoside-diphosphate-sugar epimerase